MSEEIGNAWTEEIIYVSEVLRGKGESHDPIRRVSFLFNKDGVLLAELDELCPKYDFHTGKWVINPICKTKNGEE